MFRATYRVVLAVALMGLLTVPSDVSASNHKVRNCRYKGIFLAGKVLVTSSRPDFKIRVLSRSEGSPDLKVQETTNSNDNRCGRWKFVKSGEDFRVNIVTRGEDFKIKFVQSGAGD